MYHDENINKERDERHVLDALESMKGKNGQNAKAIELVYDQEIGLVLLL